MLLFRKEWYSLNETVTLLNEYFKLDPFNDISFKIDDVIQYFMTGYLKLTIRAYITNKHLEFFESGLRMHEFDLFDVNYPVGDDEINEYSFKNENCNINKTQDKNLWLKAYGLFELIPDSTTIRRSKIKGEAFLIGGLYPFNSLSNEKKLAICCKKPFPIPFSQILISRDDIIDTIKTIKELEQNSQLEINSSNQYDTQKNEIIESQRAENETLRARIAELENQLKNQSAVNSEQVLESPKATRTSQAQRDIFSLLVVQNYPNCVTRNSLLESINADLRRIGINTKGISYPTLNNLIDEDLRIKVTTQDGKTIEKSPFPDKAKK